MGRIPKAIKEKAMKSVRTTNSPEDEQQSDQCDSSDDLEMQVPNDTSVSGTGNDLDDSNSFQNLDDFEEDQNNEEHYNSNAQKLYKNEENGHLNFNQRLEEQIFRISKNTFPKHEIGPIKNIFFKINQKSLTNSAERMSSASNSQTSSPTSSSLSPKTPLSLVSNTHTKKDGIFSKKREICIASALDDSESSKVDEECLEKFLESLNSVNTESLNNVILPELDVTNNDLCNNDDLNMSNLLQLHKPFQYSNINVKTHFLNIYMSKTNFDPSYHIICSLLNDKVYQIYRQNMVPVHEHYKKTLLQIERNEVPSYLDLSYNQVWDALIENIPLMVKDAIVFCKELPGLNELSHADFANVLNGKFFDFFILTNSCLFINGESYLRLTDDYNYTRYWMYLISERKKIDSMFQIAEMINEFSMTEKEKALLIPLVLTIPGI